MTKDSGTAPDQTEKERNEIVGDRDDTRRTVKAALAVFLSVTLDTPGDKPLDLDRLFGEFKTAALPAVREFRTRQLRRLSNHR